MNTPHLQTAERPVLEKGNERQAVTAESCQLDDGIIELDSERGARFRFTSDRFGHGSYLWKLGGTIIVSFIESLNKGNFRELAEAILASGLCVKVPTPLGRMREIVCKARYRQEWLFCTDADSVVEAWTLSN